MWNGCMRWEAFSCFCVCRSFGFFPYFSFVYGMILSGTRIKGCILEFELVTYLD